MSSSDLVQLVTEAKLLGEYPVIVTAQGLMTHRVLDGLESDFVLQSLYRLSNCRAIYLAGVERRSFSDFIPEQIGFDSKIVPAIINENQESQVTVLTPIDAKKLIGKKIKYLRLHNELDLSLSPFPHFFMMENRIINALLAQPSPTTVDISYCRLSPDLKQAMLSLAQVKPIHWRYQHVHISAINEFISFFVKHPEITSIAIQHIKTLANTITHSRILKILHDTGQEQIQQLFNFLRFFEENNVRISDDSRLIQYLKTQFKLLSQTLISHVDFTYKLIHLLEPAGDWQKFFALFDRYIVEILPSFSMNEQKFSFQKPTLAINLVNSNNLVDLGPSGLGHSGGHWVRFEDKCYHCKTDSSPDSRKLSEKLFSELWL